MIKFMNFKNIALDSSLDSGSTLLTANICHSQNTSIVRYFTLQMKTQEISGTLKNPTSFILVVAAKDCLGFSFISTGWHFSRSKE